MKRLNPSGSVYALMTEKKALLLSTFPLFKSILFFLTEIHSADPLGTCASLSSEDTIKDGGEMC